MEGNLTDQAAQTTHPSTRQTQTEASSAEPAACILAADGPRHSEFFTPMASARMLIPVLNEPPMKKHLTSLKLLDKN